MLQTHVLHTTKTAIDLIVTVGAMVRGLVLERGLGTYVTSPKPQQTVQTYVGPVLLTVERIGLNLDSNTTRDAKDSIVIVFAMAPIFVQLNEHVTCAVGGTEALMKDNVDRVQ